MQDQLKNLSRLCGQNQGKSPHLLAALLIVCVQVNWGSWLSALSELLEFLLLPCSIVTFGFESGTSLSAEGPSEPNINSGSCFDLLLASGAKKDAIVLFVVAIFE